MPAIATFPAIVDADSDHKTEARESEQHEGGKAHLLEAMRRERFLAQRHGFQYGIPKQAFTARLPRCAHPRRWPPPRVGEPPASLARPGPRFRAYGVSSDRSPSTRKLTLPAPRSATPTPMAGRLTSVAAEPHGLIVAGAASGGLWVSTNNGRSFVSVFDSQPTQSIGAVALDTTTTPSTIYVGTGEGNNSIDSLYGAGMFKSTDLGQTWTSLGPPEPSIAAAFTSIAIDTTTTPGTRGFLPEPPAASAGAGPTRESSRPTQQGGTVVFRRWRQDLDSLSRIGFRQLRSDRDGSRLHAPPMT